jgi:hypothetical protein
MLKDRTKPLRTVSEATKPDMGLRLVNHLVCCY